MWSDVLYAQTIMLLQHVNAWIWGFGMTNVYGTIQIVAVALRVTNGTPETAL